MALSAARGLRGLIRDFRRQEDGTLVVFSLFLLSIIILMSGMAVDLMRAENRRVALSQALDRCTLYATVQSGVILPRDAMDDCVDRAGMLPYLEDVQVTSAEGSRGIDARGTVPVRTMFMGASGIDQLNMAARSTAHEFGRPVEIVLALGITSSMRSDGKLAALRTAAQNFATTVLTNNPTGVSIAVVPFNGQVNLPTHLANKFNVTHRHNLGVTHHGNMAHVNCLDLPQSSYSYTGLSRTLPIPASGWADTITTPVTAGGYSTVSRNPNMNLAYCQAIPNNVIRLPDNNLNALNAYLGQLASNGFSAINMGVKWAGILLDPQFRSIIDESVNEGLVPAQFRGRPANYGPSTTKIIVVVSDRQSMVESRLNDAYRVGPSPIFVGNDGNYSIRFTSGRPAAAGANEYWVPHLSQWHSVPWAGTLPAARPMTWQQVWQDLTTAWVGYHLYARALGSTASEMASLSVTWSNNFRSQRGGSVTAPPLDADLQQICNVTKNEGVLIYSIAFSAPQHAIDTLRPCASSPAHFFNPTNGTQLNAAFQAIALNIAQLSVRQVRLVN